MNSMWPSADDDAHLAQDEPAEPDDVLVIDLPDLTATIVEDPDDRALSLLLRDDSGNAAELVTGLRDWSTEAIDALDRLVEVAGRLAALLRIRRGDRTGVFDADADAEARARVVARVLHGTPTPGATPDWAEPEPQDLAVVEALAKAAPRTHRVPPVNG